MCTLILQNNAMCMCGGSVGGDVKFLDVHVICYLGEEGQFILREWPLLRKYD